MDKAAKAAEKKAKKEAEKQKKKEEKEMKAALKKAEKERRKSRKDSVSAPRPHAVPMSQALGSQNSGSHVATEGIYHPPGTEGGPAVSAAQPSQHMYEEVSFTMTLERAQEILQNSPHSHEAEDARAFLLAEAKKLEEQAQRAKQLASLATTPPKAEGDPESMDGIRSLLGVLEAPPKAEAEAESMDGIRSLLGALDDDESPSANNGVDGDADRQRSGPLPGYVDMTPPAQGVPKAESAPGYALMTPAVPLDPTTEGYASLSRPAPARPAQDASAPNDLSPAASDPVYENTASALLSAPPPSEPTYENTAPSFVDIANAPAYTNIVPAGGVDSATREQPQTSGAAETERTSFYSPADVTTPAIAEASPDDLAQFPNMTLEDAKDVMAREVADGPEKRVAQHLLLREAANLEAQLAALSAEDETDDDDGGGEIDTPATPTVDSSASPDPLPTGGNDGTPSAAELAQFPNMTVDQAQAVMAKGLPDGNVEKRVAKHVLLREASRLEEMLAKLNASDDEAEDAETAVEPEPTPAPAAEPTQALASTAPVVAQPQPKELVTASQQLEQNAIYKATQLAQSGGVRSEEVEREAEERRRQAQEEARKLVGAQFDVDALKEKERRENEARMARLTQGGPVTVPKVVKVSRAYATEDERVQAEASLDETHARLQDITFDFSFSTVQDDTPKKPAEIKPASPPTKSEASTPSFDFSWSGDCAAANPKKETVPESTEGAPKLRDSQVDWAQKKANARKYATEDERHAAEASVEETNERLKDLSFDFSFGS